MTATRRWLEGASRPLRWALEATALLGGSAAALALLAAGAWLAHRGVYGRLPAGALLVWLAAVALGALVFLRARRALARVSPQALAGLIEAAVAWRRGSVWAVAERASGTTSADLHALADAHTAARLVSEGRRSLGDLRVRSTAGLGGAALAAALAALLLVATQPTRGRAAQFWHPLALAFRSATPVVLSAERDAVRRGGSVRLRLEAPHATEARLWTRSPGEGWRGETVALDSLGVGSVVVGPLETDLYAWATAAGGSSDTVQVTVHVPPFVADLRLVARFPAYLERPPEPVATGTDTLWLPSGTAIETDGRLIGAALGSAEWRSGDDRHALSHSGAEFRGRFVPRRSGRWTLEVTDSGGQAPDGEPPTLVLSLIPDLPPEVRLAVPAGDTTLPLSLVHPVVADVDDDYGITAAELVMRRVSRLGVAGAPWTEPVEVGPAAGDHAVLAVELDVRDRGLLPGDTVRLRVRAADNAPTPQWGESEEIALRLPSLAELRDDARSAARSVAESVDSLTEIQRALEREAGELAAARQRPAEGEPGGQRSGERAAEALEFDRAERARAVVEQQGALQQRLEELREELSDVQRAIAAAGLTDPEWQRQLEELRELIDRALTPELADRLDELREALERLDAPATREALERLAQAQARLREELERSRELFERAALEGALETLAQDAEQLQAEQQRWTEQAAARADSAAAAREEELAARADSLATELEAVARDLSGRTDDARQERIAAAADSARRAAGEMRAGARAASGGDAREAGRRGERASDLLEGMPEALRAERDALAGQWREEVLDALDRSLAETARMATEQEAIIERLRRGESGSDLRGQQAAAEQGVRQLAEQVRDAAGRNALVAPELPMAFDLAQRKMAQSRSQLERPMPNARDAAALAREALDALNEAAFGLVRTRGQVAGAQSGSGLAEAIEAMGRLARQQGRLNSQTGELMPMVGGGAPYLDRLRQLAAEQRALAEALDRLGASGDAPGRPERMAEEAREIAEVLEQGRLDPEVLDRQEELFRRLLDAGRSLEGPEPDPQRERVSETARARAPGLPDTTGMRPAEPAFRYPTWEELSRLTPDERRLILEYFRRLNRARGGR